MHHTCRSLLVVAVALALGSMLSGCTSAVPDSSPDKPDITVSVLPSEDSAGFFIALRDGLFAAHGLHVTYVPASTDSAEVIADQMAGDYDVTGESYVAYIEAAAHSHDRLRIFDEGSLLEQGSVALYTLPGSGVTSVNNLAGTYVGVDTMFGTDYLLDVSALTDRGQSPTSVNFVPVSLPDMENALKSGLINVATLPEPYAGQIAAETGAVELADLDSSSTQNFAVEGYAVTAAWAAEHPSTLAAFQTALEQGQEIADTQPAELQQAVAQYAGVSALNTALMQPEDFPLGVDVEQIQRVAGLMQEFDLLGAPFDVRSIIGG
jgi:NitT/TauT family transport system substrate-binding protein